MANEANQMNQTNQTPSGHNGFGKRGRKGLENLPLYRCTTNQAMALNTSSIIGVGVLTLPRSTSEVAHQFGWISILIAVLIAAVSVAVIARLGRRFPNQTFVEYTRVLFGRDKHPLVGKILSVPIQLVYIAYWVFVTALVARTFGEVVVTAVLVNTPLEVIVGTMLLLCLLLACYDAEVVIRINEVLLVIIVIPILFIALSAYQSARMELIMPLWPTGHWKGVALGVVPALTSFLGFEAAMQFNAHIPSVKHMLRGQIIGIAIPGLLYLLIVIAGIAAFGYEELHRQAWPTLELIKSVNVPGLILERMEAIFLGVWVAAVFTTTGNWFYCANWTIAEMIGVKKRIWSAPVVLVGIYLIAMRSGNIQQLFKWLDFTGYLGIAAASILPLFMLLLAMARKLDFSKQAEGEEGDVREAG